MSRRPLSDRLISYLSPGWAARRARSRLHFEVASQQRAALSSYEAADKGRTSDDWPSRNKSADQAITPDYDTLLARARAAVRDNWAAASISDGYVRHVVGTGITARAAARDLVSLEPLDNFNAAIDRLWGRWATNPRWVDRERRKTFVDFQSLGIRELIPAGQAFCVASYEPRVDMVGLVLQMFESEQLDTSLSNAGNGNEIERGVEIDDYGAPVAYHFYEGKHPYTGWRAQSTRILAERVLHLMRPERVRQTNGVTRMAAVLRELWHAKMYEEYTLLRARFEACGGVAIESEPGALGGGFLGLRTGETTGTPAEDTNSNTQLNIEPNMVWDLPPGKRLNYMDPKVPGSNYEPFSRQQVKKIAAGAGLDYPTVSRDFSGCTYSGQRQGMIETWAETEPEQVRLINLWLRPIREKFVAFAVLEGRVAAPNWNTSAEWRGAYCETEWQPPAKPWIDPANQAAAAKLQLEQRLTTRRKILNELGEDYREVLRQTSDEQKLADRLGITLPESAGDAPVNPREPRPAVKEPVL